MEIKQTKLQKLHDDICFYFLCSSDFEQVITTFELLKTCVDSQLRYRLFVFIIISYARPFTQNRGNVKSHSLKKTIVPTVYRKLHDEVIEYRDRVVAHTDVDFRNPHLGEIGMFLKHISNDTYQALLLNKPVLNMVETITGNLAMKIAKARVNLERYQHKTI